MFAIQNFLLLTILLDQQTSFSKMMSGQTREEVMRDLKVKASVDKFEFR